MLNTIIESKDGEDYKSYFGIMNDKNFKNKTFLTFSYKNIGPSD